jgi:hypothetical protein
MTLKLTPGRFFVKVKEERLAFFSKNYAADLRLILGLGQEFLAKVCCTFKLTAQVIQYNVHLHYRRTV